ncbi:hypothetical protein [Pseudarthrobacter sp. NBSH8]|uniref:hypothetical protein n=1 Tax=Pseudarthrobacter sp. NBSH8 TaxID=2596911 RepID=UPI0016266AF5|nr:hypothetical protein [Pseudarthrobacter sp. NBSH8]QNE13775.1 hypothetical protein FYJ92_04365 [Pseudarthrobacter sp. NBSH8]
MPTRRFLDKLFREDGKRFMPTTAGILMLPAAAAVPVVVALVILVTGRKHANPPGPKESG